MDSATLCESEVQENVQKWLALVPGNTDFVVKLQIFEIPCHKVILRKSSCYFEALFESQMKEAESNTCTLILNGTEAKALLSLLDFAYTHQLDVNEENMFQLASLSNMYQFTIALDLCVNFIASKISSQTWVDILLFSEIHQLRKLYSAALRFILWHFPKEMETGVDKFKQLPKELLSKILGHPLLNCNAELDVIRVLEKWEQSCTECTNKEYVELFKSVVYVGDMTCEQVKVAIKCDSVQRSKELRQLLEKATKIKELSISGSTEKINCSANTGSACRRGPLLMLCVGGDESQVETTLPSKCIYQVDPFTAKVDKFKDLDKLFPAFETKMGYRACTVGTDMYITGGEVALGRNKFLMDVWRYSSFDNTWHPQTSLTQPRRHHGIAVLGDTIFLIGGIGKYRQVLTSVESYNTVTDEWMSLSSLRTAEFWPAVTVCRGEIYCVKNSQQKYSPVTDQWTTLTMDLPFNLGFHSAVCVCDSIFMKCQYDGRMVRVNTEQGMTAETVTTFASAPNGQLVAFKNRIYCIGGEDSSELQYYDVSSRQLRTVDKLDLSLTGTSLLVFPHYPDQL